MHFYWTILNEQFLVCTQSLGMRQTVGTLKIYDAAARRRGLITKDIFIEDNSHE